MFTVSQLIIFCCVMCLFFVICYVLCLLCASKTPWGQNVKVDTGWTYNSEGSMFKYNSYNNNRFSLWQLHKSSVEQVIVRTDFNKMTVPQRRREHHQPVHILSHHIPMFCHAPPGLKQTHKAPLGVCMKPQRASLTCFKCDMVTVCSGLGSKRSWLGLKKGCVD